MEYHFSVKLYKEAEKINFDATIRENKTSVAVVGRNNHGKVVLTWTDILDPRSPLWGEAKKLPTQL